MEDIELNESIVMIARATGWSIEYIRELPVADFKMIARELRYQLSVEEWRNLRGFALVLTNWANSQSNKTRVFNPEDFIGDEPKRQKEKETTNDKKEK